MRLSSGKNGIPPRVLPLVILPNSFMSAPATKVLPAPIITAAFTVGSLSICSIASEMPSGTPGLSAFTGGLLIIMIAMSLSFESWTRSLMGILSLADRNNDRGKSIEWPFSPSNDGESEQRIRNGLTTKTRRSTKNHRRQRLYRTSHRNLGRQKLTTDSHG